MKKFVAVLCATLLFSAHPGIASCGENAPAPYTRMACECSILGKWQMMSLEAEGTVKDMKDEGAIMEFSASIVSYGSKNDPGYMDMYVRNGNTITITDTETGEKQHMEIMECTETALSLKTSVEGVMIVQKLKKIQ